MTEHDKCVSMVWRTAQMSHSDTIRMHACERGDIARTIFVCTYPHAICCLYVCTLDGAACHHKQSDCRCYWVKNEAKLSLGRCMLARG